MKKLGFGLMRLPLKDPDDAASVDIEQVKSMADAFLAHGFTYFDTAAPYHKGQSEVAFREAVAKRYPRNHYTITDKLSLFMVKGEEEFSSFFDAQLERLGVEYVDYYLLHALGARSYSAAEQQHAFAFLEQLKAEGKTRHIGFSYHDTPELLDEILTKHPEMEFVQLQLNYLDWEDAAIQSKACYEVVMSHGKRVLVMEPVKGGSLIQLPEAVEALYRQVRPKLSAASWAIRFAASQMGVDMVLSGMSNLSQMEDNISYMKSFQPMNARELETLAQGTALIRASIAIPCTACRYCVDDCPKHIAIPDYFSIYNNHKRFGEQQQGVVSIYYKNAAASHGKASECLQCGKCEGHCPQHLPIRQYLQQVAAALE